MQFSSRPPFNDDPDPYQMWLRDGFMAHRVQRFSNLEEARVELDMYGGSPRGGEVQLDPRLEFDRPQHNPTNPVLAQYRERIEKTGEHPYWDATMDYLDFAQDFPHLSNADPAHAQHARRVLTRLANLTNDKEN